MSAITPVLSHFVIRDRQLPTGGTNRDRSRRLSSHNRFLAILLLLTCLRVPISQAAPPTGYYLVWADEFNTLSLDTSKWDYWLLGNRRDAVNIQPTLFPSTAATLSSPPILPRALITQG